MGENMAMFLMFCVVLLSATSCSTESITMATFLRRIESLETRDTVNSERIYALEQQGKEHRDRLQQLTEHIKAQDNALEHYRYELQEKETLIDGLKYEFQQLVNLVDSKNKTIVSMQNQLANVDLKIELCAGTIDKMNSIQIKHSKKIEALEFLKTMLLSDMNDQLNLKGNVTWKKNLDHSKDQKHQTAHDQIKDKHSARIHSDQNRQTPQVPAVQNGKRQQTKEAATMVAFHAVVTPFTPDFGTPGNIVFDTILLNVGSGYHGQHGLFVAPRRGLYLFSASVTAPNAKHFWASLLKNGQHLADIIGYGEADLEQSSVTVVTLLEPGDEVWVRNFHGDGIWGNRFTSFTGVLLFET